jgi:hypothetical protein
MPFLVAQCRSDLHPWLSSTATTTCGPDLRCQAHSWLSGVVLETGVEVWRCSASGAVVGAEPSTRVRGMSGAIETCIRLAKWRASIEW